MPAELRGPSHAKINLSLEVLGTRPDGYHEIDTIVQTLELAGEVCISFDAEPCVSISGPFADGVPADESNLAWRAAAELARAIGREIEPLHIHLDKQVPPAGGLGGGAADAATVLRLLGTRWRAPREAIFEAAARVGSDEPALLLGGAVRATGRGEIVTPLRESPARGVVLFVPPTSIAGKTGRLFAELDRHPFDTGHVTASMVERWPQDWTSLDVYNAFERVAFDVFDGLAHLWEDVEERINASPEVGVATIFRREAVRLAGAGPTLFWIGDDARADAVAEAATGAACTIIRTRTQGPLWTR